MAMLKGTTYRQKTDEEIMEALEQTHGLVNQSAKLLGITRNALSTRLNSNPHLNAYRKSCRESALDLAEGQLIECVKRGSFPAIAFLLKTIGKERGYTEEITVNSNNFNQNIDLSKLSAEDLKVLNELVNKSITNTESDSGGDL